MPGTPNTPTIKQWMKVIFIVNTPMKFITYKIIAPMMLFFSNQNGSETNFISAKIITMPMIVPITTCKLIPSKFIKKIYFLSKAGSATPFAAKAAALSRQVAHLPQGISPRS